MGVVELHRSERTTTEPAVRYVGDIHLAYMPWSHSVLTVVAGVVVVWAFTALAGSSRLGVILGLGILTHLVLDILTHNGDIPLGPYAGAPHFGTFLYGRFPLVAFLVELGYGLVCWRVFRGGPALLAIIVAFNLANLSLFFPGDSWARGTPGRSAAGDRDGSEARRIA